MTVGGHLRRYKLMYRQQSGFIGRAVVPELLSHGYEVLGLARSDASAEALSKAGASVTRGDLHNLESLEEGAKASDGVVHLAFINDFSSPEAFAKATATDRAAITAMAEAMEGTNNPLIICSGTLGYPHGSISNEDTQPTVTPGFDRDLAAPLIYSLSKEKSIRGMVMCLAPVVHGKGDDHGFIPMIGHVAQKNGFVACPGNGSARWTACHVKDAAVAFRLAFEKGRAAATYLPIAEGQVPVKDIAATIGKKLGLPVENKPTEELMPLIGFIAVLLSADTPVNNDKTKQELGYEPKEVDLLEDIAANYFN